MKLYGELVSWWPLLSAPAEYAEEAAFYRKTLVDACERTPRSLLELGSGGGNNASHLKAHFDEMVLVDLSPGMLAHSRVLNPECEHVEADMRNVRLAREFEAVFVHDAIGYMQSETQLRQAMQTAFVHCKAGGVALFAPDHVRENFRASTDHGGHDGADRSLRYLEWSWDPDPGDTSVVTDYAYLLRLPDASVRVVHDRHVEGLFPRADWLRLLREVGFVPRIVPVVHSGLDADECEAFVARKPAGPSTGEGHCDPRDAARRAIR